MDIRKVRSYVISLKNNNDERRQAMTALMNEIGAVNWSFFDAFDVRSKQVPNFYGCGISRREALVRATYPCIIYEDDIEKTSWFRPVIDLPEDQIGYLGISIWGTKGRDTGWPGGMTLHDVGSSEYVKAVEMLAHHAVYYPTKELAMAYSEGTIRQLLENDAPSDIALAKKQTEMNVYCLKQPLFCQGNYNERWTNFEVCKNMSDWPETADQLINQILRRKSTRDYS